MKKSLGKALCLALALLCISAVAVGCRSEQPPAAYTDLSYSTASVLYAEPGYKHGSTVSLRKTMETTAVDATSYAFEPSISAEERTNCIRETEAILDALACTHPLLVAVYETHTLSAPYAAEGALYTPVRYWRNPESVTALLLALYGEYGSYGLAYGYAVYLCEQVYGTPADTAAPAFPADFPYYDLNYLCFHPNFVSETDLATVKSIAVDFVRSYITANGEESLRDLLVQSGQEDRGASDAALSAYYKAHGVEVELSHLQYGMGGKGCQYVVRSPYATFCVQEDWLDRLTLLYPDVYDGFLNRDYAETNRFFTVQTRQMEQYRALFSLGDDPYRDGLSPYRDDLVVVFSNRNTDASYYLPDEHYIELVNISSLMHEYIHALTYHRIFSEEGLGEGWVSEGLARYYGSLYSEYGNRMLYEDYSTAEDLQPFLAPLGRPLDLSRDMVDILNIVACRNGRTIYESVYVSGASFIHYLTVTFGERETLQYLLEDYDFSALTDKPFEDVLEDWQSYLQENYGKYCQ